MTVSATRIKELLEAYVCAHEAGTVRTGIEVAELRPDLVIELPGDIRIAIEILDATHSPSGTTRKIGTYFEAGTQEVWLIDPIDGMVELWTSPRFPLQLTDDDVISSIFLPGFSLPLPELFA